ncbi:MAG: CoA transferase [Gammaproteobacteria bacterium]|nr:CoA transferase [Gammaproteobacteria bacterium]
MSENQSPPLDGLFVLDFSRVVAGPYLTQMLGDLGADVIKIEAPGTGDDMRHYKPPGWTGSDAPGFLGLNRNKQSVELDIRTPAGQAVCRELVEKADILVENFRPDVMERFNLHYSEMAKVNPRLIYCSISGYGHSSPFKMVAGYDPIAQAETGMMYLTGPSEVEPQKAGGSIGDTFTSLHAGMGIMAALEARHRTGRGQHVDVSLFDSMLGVLGSTSQISMLMNEEVPRVGNRSLVLVPMGVYDCSDGSIMIVVGNDRQFQKLCVDVFARPDLAGDPRFESIKSRLAHREVLEALVRDQFATNTRDYWVEKMRTAGVPAGSVREPGAAVRSAEATGRQMVCQTQYEGETIDVVGSPIRLSETPVAAPRPVPRLGEHTESVLRDLLGYDDAAIAKLRQ